MTCTVFSKQYLRVALAIWKATMNMQVTCKGKLMLGSERLLNGDNSHFGMRDLRPQASCPMIPDAIDSALCHLIFFRA